MRKANHPQPTIPATTPTTSPTLCSDDILQAVPLDTWEPGTLRYWVAWPDSTLTEHHCSLIPGCSYEDIVAVALPWLNTRDIERVKVLKLGSKTEYTDLIVDAHFLQKGLPENPMATAIYQRNALLNGNALASDLPVICGMALWFEQPVWS